MGENIVFLEGFHEGIGNIPETKAGDRSRDATERSAISTMVGGPEE